MKPALRIRPISFMLLGTTVLCADAQADGLLLASDGETNHVITLPSDPDEPVRTAAKELQSHLQRVTGVELPIIADNEVSADAPRSLWGPAGN